MNRKNLLAGWMVLSSSLSFAQGNNVGGGGTVIILPNDDIVMSEAFKKDKTPMPVGTLMKLGEPLVKELVRAEQLMRFHSGYFDTESDLFTKNIFASTTQYILINEEEFEKLRWRCPFWQRKVEKPEDSKQVDIGCTIREKTYILESIFSKMTLRRQAEFIIHERLMSTDLSSEWDIDFILGQVNRGLELTFKQLDQEVKGIYHRLSDEEVTTLKEFAQVIAKYSILSNGIPRKNVWHGSYYNVYNGYSSEQVVVHPNGGGLYVKGSKIDPDAYLGIHTIFLGEAQKGAVFVSETKQFCNGCSLKEGAQAVHNTVSRPTPFSNHLLGDGSIRNDILLDFRMEFDHFAVVLENGAKLIGNIIRDQSGSMDAMDRDTQFQIYLGTESSIVNSHIKAFYKGHPDSFLLAFQLVNFENVELDVSFSRKRQLLKNYITGPIVLPVMAGVGIVTGLATIPWINQWGPKHPTNWIEDKMNNFGQKSVALMISNIHAENVKCNVSNPKNKVEVTSETLHCQ